MTLAHIALKSGRGDGNSVGEMTRRAAVGAEFTAALARKRKLPGPYPRTSKGAQWYRRPLPNADDILADQAAIETVLGLTLKRQKVEPMTRALLKTFGSFERVISASDVSLWKVEGMTESTVQALRSVPAVALHMLRKKAYEGPVIRSWSCLTNYLVSRLQYELVEVVFAIFLDNQTRIISDEEMGRGTINYAPVYPKHVMQRCLDLNASSIVLVHNHPSGCIEPSREDVHFTKNLIKAAELFDVAVHDHVIVGKGEFFSFRERGII